MSVPGFYLVLQFILPGDGVCSCAELLSLFPLDTQRYAVGESFISSSRQTVMCLQAKSV